MAKGDKTPVEQPSSASAAAARNILSSEAQNHADKSSGDAGHTDGGFRPFPTLLGVHLGSERMAVESDAEAGFAAGEDRFFKKPHYRNSISRANRHAASQDLPNLQISSHSLNEARNDPPQIVVEGSSPQTLRRSASQVLTIPSPVRRRRWGSSLYNALTPSEPATAPLPDESKKVTAKGHETPQSASASVSGTLTRSFLARLRSTSLTALTSPFARMSGARDETRSLAGTSTRGEDERWSSESSSEEDEFLWKDSLRLAPDSLSLAMEMGDEGEQSSWGAGSGVGSHRSGEAEDADLSREMAESA